MKRNKEKLTKLSRIMKLVLLA